MGWKTCIATVRQHLQCALIGEKASFDKHTYTPYSWEGHHSSGAAHLEEICHHLRAYAHCNGRAVHAEIRTALAEEKKIPSRAFYLEEIFHHLRAHACCDGRAVLQAGAAVHLNQPHIQIFIHYKVIPKQLVTVRP